MIGRHSFEQWLFIFCAIENISSTSVEAETSEISFVDSSTSEVSQVSVGKQLLRRESEDDKHRHHSVALNPSGDVAYLGANHYQGKGGNCSEDVSLGGCDQQRVQLSGAIDQKHDKVRMSAIVPHNLAADLHEDSNALDSSSRGSTWQVISIGDAAALTIHGGVIYIVAHDEKLHVLEQGIYAQPLNRMTPYSNWTLIGLGSLSSIAVHDGHDGKAMYGVGNNSWLYRQKLATMRSGSVWELASFMTLKSIAIYGDTIYGVSKEQPSQVFKLSCDIFGQENATLHGWYPFTSGPIKSFSIVGDSMFAILGNNMIYNKSVARENGRPIASDEEVIDWTLANNENMLSVAVLGDTMYGVSLQHKVCRTPIVVHSDWAPIASGSMMSIAVHTNGETIYGAGIDGRVYKQNLLTMSSGSQWAEASGPSVNSIAIQGATIYGVGPDKLVYKQLLETMNSTSSWEEASSCCVLQIASADGILYAIHEDANVYGQIGMLMSKTSKWVLLVHGPVTSIAIRGDLMYGITPDGSMLTQRLSSMGTTTPWIHGHDLSDNNFPSHAYASIMAHNDIMYACGLDHVVYSKLIHHEILYPPGLAAHGGTREQALTWNITFAHIPKQLQSHAHNLTTTMARLTTLPTTTSFGPTTTAATTPMIQHSEPGVSANYIDSFRDRRSNVTFAQAGALRHAHVRFSVVSALSCLYMIGIGGV